MEPYGPPSPEAVRLAAALRRLQFVTLDPDVGDTRRAELAGSIELLLDATEPRSRYTPAEQETFVTSPLATVDPRGTHPFYGVANPSGVAMTFGGDGDRVLASTRFDARHEGAPGWAHGGVVATGFDIILGRAAITFGGRGPTGSMSIRYAAPTPLGVDVVFAAWLDRQETRKTFVEAELRRVDTEQVCASGSAVFVRPRGA